MTNEAVCIMHFGGKDEVDFLFSRKKLNFNLLSGQ